ncbi:MAG: 2-oxoacid:acceptor oxidoreductase subunit alpha, partial [Jiangellaceae bacterium]
MVTERSRGRRGPRRLSRPEEPPQGRRRHTVTDKQVRAIDRVIIRFAGDSGDGMQLTGDRFTAETASFGN